MTRIDPPPQWSALLRSQLEQAARVRTSPTQPAATTDGPTRGTRSAPPGVPGRPSGHASAALRLRAIGPDDPERRRKAFRIFMEGTLQDEFGHVLEGTNDFDALVEQVTSQMYDDPKLRKACDMAADALLATPRAP